MYLRGKIKTALSVVTVLAVVISQFAFALPQASHAETAGDVLTIRVQYYGDREDKVRDKAQFTKAQLEAMSAGTYIYTNVTRVGTVMTTKARGPKVADLLKAAGIDLNSIECIYFRTTDGTGQHQRYSRAFYVGQHLTSTRYYYPYLSLPGDILQSDGETIIPPDGSLDKPSTVPAILAIESKSSKDPNVNSSKLKMDSEYSYRFCFGQSKLTVGKRTKAGYDGGDVSSMDSAHSIFGIDVVLKGYPPISGISLSMAKDGLEIGSQRQITASVSGGDGTTDASDLTWTSSNESVASVSDAGMMTINGEGTAKITAKAANGVTASMTITVKGETVTKEIDNPDFNPDEEESETNPRTISTEETVYNVDVSFEDGVAPNEKVITRPVKEITPAKNTVAEEKPKKEKKEVKTIKAKQVSLNELKQAPRDGTTSQDVQALDSTEQYGAGTKAIAGGIGLGVFGLGAAMRYRRYRIDR